LTFSTCEATLKPETVTARLKDPTVELDT